MCSSPEGREEYLFSLDILDNAPYTEENLAKAFVYAIQSAEKGCSYGIYLLGVFYEYGYVVEKDTQISLRYYSKASLMHNQNACFNLAMLLAEGLGLIKDMEQAKREVDNSISYALDNIIAGDYLAKDFLYKKFGLSEENINNLIEEYKDSIRQCDICGRLIVKKKSEWPRKREFNGLDFSIKDDQIDIFCSDPIVQGGICCQECFDWYVGSVREMQSNGYLSLQELREIMEKEDCLDILFDKVCEYEFEKKHR